MPLLSTHSPTDSELVQEFARTGAQTAFEQLVDRHAAWVFAAAYRQLRDQHLAEDATQAAFLLLAKKAHRMSQNQKISGWLFNATQYTVKSILRSNRRREKYERGAAKSDTAVSEQASDLSEYLDAAVAKLSAKDRLIVLMRFYQGLDFTQIAESMNLTEFAARRRLSRAVARLRLGVSADTLGAAAMVGRESMPGHLCQQVSQSAISKTASTGAGAIHLTTVAKILAIGIAVAAPISLHTARRAPAIKLAATLPIISAPSPPAPMTQYEKRCVPNAGQIILWVKRPFPSDRLQYYRERTNRAQVKAAPNGPTSMLLHWKQGKLQWDTMDFGGTLDTHQLMRSLLGIFPHEIEGDQDLLSSINMKLPGDIVVREGATRQQICLGLEEIVFQQLTVPVSLKLLKVPRKVIVLSGQWHYTPVSPKYNNGIAVQIYGRSLGQSHWGTTGGEGQFSGYLGQWIGEQVVIEGKGVPEYIFLSCNYKDGEEGSPFAHDRDLVLKHIQEQTGLTWSEQMRTVERLFVQSQ